MRFLSLFLFLVLCKPLFTPAQNDTIQPPEEDIHYYSELIDTLQFYNRAKQISTTSNEGCPIPGHQVLLLKNVTAGVPVTALNISPTNKNDFILMWASIRAANRFHAKKEYEEQIMLEKKALNLAAENKFTYEEIHHIRIMLNNVYFLTGKYTEAMKNSIEGLKKAENLNDLYFSGHYNAVLGEVMMKFRNWDFARSYFKKYLQLSRQIKNKFEEAKAIMYLADVDFAQKKYAEAIVRNNTALLIYDKYKPVGYSGRRVFAFCKLSEIYKSADNIDSALYYWGVTWDILKHSPTGHNEYDLVYYFINAGEIYNRLNKPDFALTFLKIAYKKADSIRHKEFLRDACKQLSTSYSLLKQYDSSYHYLSMFSDLNESLAKENSEREILQREYELQVQKRNLEQKAERNTIIILSLLAIVILALFFNRRRIKQRMLYQQQLYRQQNEMFNLAATMQEKERKRIAEDIHDGLGSVISAAKLELSSMNGERGNLSNHQREKYEATLSLLDEAAAELRNVSYNLMPATLSKLGLVAALKNVTEKISAKSDLLVEFDAHGMETNMRLEESAEISIYRIVMELLNNIIKHAGATKATVQVIKYNDYINITVEDNGKGFEYSNLPQDKKGIGLNSIESRVKYLNSTIDIDSQPGKGTVTIIDIPYKMENKIP
jgi:two-component system, NarL family, sensor kinase